MAEYKREEKSRAEEKAKYQNKKTKNDRAKYYGEFGENEKSSTSSQDERNNWPTISSVSQSAAYPKRSLQRKIPLSGELEASSSLPYHIHHHYHIQCVDKGSIVDLIPPLTQIAKTEDAMPKANTSNIKPIQCFYPKQPCLEGTTKDVEVVFGNQPTNFYCQLKENSTSFQALMTKLCAAYSDDSKGIGTPHLGMACVAKYKVDDAWYRGRIIADVESKLVGVLFVDYGNVQHTPISFLKAMEREFVELPPQAYRCSLFNVRNTNGWTAEEKLRFLQATKDKQLTAVFPIKPKTFDVTRKLEVVLREYNPDGSSILINKLFMLARGLLKTPSFLPEDNSVVEIDPEGPDFQVIDELTDSASDAEDATFEIESTNKANKRTIKCFTVSDSEPEEITAGNEEKEKANYYIARSLLGSNQQSEVKTSEDQDNQKTSKMGYNLVEFPGLKGATLYFETNEKHFFRNMKCEDSQFFVSTDFDCKKSKIELRCQAKPGGFHNHEKLSQEMLELAVIRWACILRVLLNHAQETNAQSVEVVVSSWPNKLSFPLNFIKSKFTTTLNRYRRGAEKDELFAHEFLANHGEEELVRFRQLILQNQSIPIARQVLLIKEEPSEPLRKRSRIEEPMERK